MAAGTAGADGGDGAPLRIGLVQLNVTDDPAANLPVTEAFVREAAAGGARLVITPEVTNIVSASRAHQEAVLGTEAEDATLATLRAVAAETGIWLVIGSLALKEPAAGDDRFVNRQFVIGPDGTVVARYDKIHMFDVELGGEESYRESEGFRPGAHAVVADTPFARLGLGICYDVRFPALFRATAEAGASILLAPAAFTVPTGRAHWEVLLRARAIETGSFVLAAAQTGQHRASRGKERATWGHSLAVAPWGDVIADGGEAPGVTFAELDLSAVAAARRRIPALANARRFEAPSAVSG
ncbi:MAG: carbon-nitrogen hydrolase family protein [Pseudomonadota bacterium]